MATPLSISFSVSTPKYRVVALDLPHQVHEIQVNFEEGEHVFTSPDLKLGTILNLGGKTLVGRFSFRYTYDAALDIITVCDTDYASADGMTLATMPEGTDEACFEHASKSGFAADEVYRNKTWNYHVQLMPGAAKVFKDITRDASNALISALKQQPKLSVRLRKTMPRVPMEDYLALCAVYRDGAFLEAFNEYRLTDQIGPIESVLGGRVTVAFNTPFANGEVPGTQELTQCRGLDYGNL